MAVRRSWAEPWKIKMIEPIRMTTREHREAAIREAGYNTFLLQSDDVYIDLLTDSGTSAMSENQWAGLMLGDEAYAGSRSYRHLCEAIAEVYGYPETVPTHQGRGAEHILSQILIEPGDVIPGNMYFTTTRFHQEYAGGKFVDVDHRRGPPALQPPPLQGQLRPGQAGGGGGAVRGRPHPLHLQRDQREHGRRPAHVDGEHQGRTWEFCRERGILVMLDATRALENAWFIKQREAGLRRTAASARSSRRSARTPTAPPSPPRRTTWSTSAGFLALRDPELARRARALLVAFEGLQTYGGMSGRDMEALARGIREMVETDDHVRARVGQVEYLGRLIAEAGVPIVLPVGGHGVFLDARSILAHLPQDHFPAQALAAALYVDSGVRAMERGIVSAGRNKETGDHNRPKLELVRLTIPRRVYTQSHMDVTAESVAAVYGEREKVRGLRFTYEPPDLRFFQARFEPIEA